MRVVLCLLSAAVALSACAPQGSNSGPIAIATKRHYSGPNINGRLIFFTGKDVADFQITARPAPQRPSCAACHGASGAGGVHFPSGAISADLRHKALVVDQKHPYTLKLLERAISTGIDNEGKPLDPVMPNWKMSKRDLHDVAAYVLSLK